MIRALGLVKDYGQVRAVDHLSFDIAPGEIYGLLGPNGAGKTSTMRLLCGLLQPTAGSALVAGFDVGHDPHAVRQQVGILTEVPGLYMRLTPWEYLTFFGEIYGLDGAKRAARIESLLRLVGLWDERRRVMRAFSKGMQQRVAIARTLLQDPPVLLLDEPTAALDPEAARAVRDHVLALATERDRTVLLCTHNLPEAEQLCSRLSIVQHGRQVAEGSLAQLKNGAASECALRVASMPASLLEGVAALPEVEDACVRDARTLVFRTRQPEQVNPRVVRLAVEAGADVLRLEQHEVTLEDVYLRVMATAG